MAIFSGIKVASKVIDNMKAWRSRDKEATQWTNLKCWAVNWF